MGTQTKLEFTHSNVHNSLIEFHQLTLDGCLGIQQERIALFLTWMESCLGDGRAGAGGLIR
jgi:hypothetical protein